MLQTPVRLLIGLRPQLPASILMGSIISTVVFTATPFLLPAIAGEMGSPVGAVGLISTAQLAGFVIASFGAGRLLRPGPWVLVGAAFLGVVANVGSALAPALWWLILARFLSGLAIGAIDWMAWREVFGESTHLGDVAVIGPLVGTIMAPVLAWAIDLQGSPTLFWAFAALHLAPLALLGRSRLAPPTAPRGARHRPTPAAALILVMLTMMTLGGSSVFVYAAAIGTGVTQMSPAVVALAFSANSLAGIPSARYRGTRTHAGWWVGASALSALAISLPQVPVTFFVGMALWGFTFWMAVPAAFTLLASRSRYPVERAGDAQAMLAFGRVIGPALGGLLLSVASVRVMGAVGGALMVTAAVGLWWAEHRMSPVTPAAADRPTVIGQGSVDAPQHPQ